LAASAGITISALAAVNSTLTPETSAYSADRQIEAAAKTAKKEKD
jgi:hypothetical protein